jgi:hypothetical protein
MDREQVVRELVHRRQLGDHEERRTGGEDEPTWVHSGYATARYAGVAQW